MSGHEWTGLPSVTLPALPLQNVQEPQTFTEDPAAATCWSSPAPPPTLHPRLGLEHLQSEGRVLLESPGQRRASRNLRVEGEALDSPCWGTSTGRGGPLPHPATNHAQEQRPGLSSLHTD